jgi:hypothetical protein
MKDSRDDVRNQQPFSMIPHWMWAAVVAVVFFAIYNAWDARQLQKHISEMQETARASMEHRTELHGQLELIKREAMILTDPKSETFLLSASDKKIPHMKVMWHENLGLCVMGHGIPIPAGNRTLQLWLIPKAPDSKPMPSMTLLPDAQGRVMLCVPHPPEDMVDTKAIAITEEPAGGSTQPSGPPMWMGSVS